MVNRLLVVTGAAGDVGAALVERALGAGVEVIAADIRTSAVATTGRQSVSHRELDLTDDTSVLDFAQFVRTRCAQDPPAYVGVAHCAGVAQLSPFGESDTDSWDLMYRVNQRGPLLLTQALLPQVTAAAESSIVFVGSDSARAGAGHEVVYAATKAALLGACKSLARELARDGTRVNVVSPGPIAGHMVHEATAAEPTYLDRLKRTIPLRRLATPAEVAGTIFWLLGPDATYITGQTLSVSGGITMQ